MRQREGERTLPAGLDVPAFRQAWDDWVAHLQSKHNDKVSLHTLDLHLEQCRTWGAAASIAAIDHCRRSNFSRLELPRHFGRGAPGASAADTTETGRRLAASF